MYDQQQQPGVLDRIMKVWQFAQMMKQSQWAEEDRQRGIDQQSRANARQDVQDTISLNQMGARRGDRFVEQGLDETLGPVANPRSRVRVGQQDYYLPSRQEEQDQGLRDFAQKLRTQQTVAGEDDVEISLPEPIAKIVGLPKIKVPQQHVAAIAESLNNIMNPPLHPYQTTNEYGDVTPYGVNPRTMEVKKGQTLYGAGKPLAQTKGKGKAAYTSHDLDTQAEADVIGAAQKKYGDKLMLEAPEVGAAIASIKKQHPEFDDAAAREYLQRVGPRLPQYKGLFADGRLRQEDYRKSAQFRKDYLNRRIQLKKQYESQAGAAGPSAADRQAADQVLQGAIDRVNASNLSPAKKTAAIRELQRAHQSRWGSK